MILPASNEAAKRCDMPDRSHKRDGFASLKSLDITTAADASSSCDPPTQDGVDVGLVPARPIVAGSFDYTTLAPDLAERARETARRIHGVLQRAIIQIGQELLAIKHEMSHGTFTRWINAEMGGTTLRTAENYMRVARWVEGKPETVALLPPTVLYALTSPSASTAVVGEVLAAAETGNPLPVATIKAKVKASKAERCTGGKAKKSHQIADGNIIPKSMSRVHVDRRTLAYQPTAFTHSTC
jgi:hypothetical protein